MSNTDFLPCWWQRGVDGVPRWRECAYPVPQWGRTGIPIIVIAHDCARCPVREERSARERILERLAEVTYLGRTYDDVVRRIVNEELPE